MNEVKTDDVVKVHYTGKLADGQTFDSSKDKEPIEFKVGEGNVIPGFENAVKGMKVNESKKVTIPAADAYGPVREELKYEVEKNKLPQDINPKEGMQLISKQPDNREVLVTIDEVKDNSIIIDANHPLAGKDLVFEIEVVDIK